MIPLGEKPGAMSKKQLLKHLQGPLNKFFGERLDMQIEIDRVVQVAHALRNELFWRGKQHLSLNFDDQGGSKWETLIPGSEETSAQGTKVLRYVFNITKSDGMKYISVVGNRAPHAKAVPDVPEDGVQVRSATRADMGVRYLIREWDADRIQKDVSRIQWKTGPAFAHVHWQADGDKYGHIEEPVWGDEEIELSPEAYVCPTCQAEHGAPYCEHCDLDLTEANLRPAQKATVPRIVETKRYPNGRVEIDLYSTLEVVVPRHIKRLEDADYLRLERLIPRTRLYALYAEVLGKNWLKAESGDRPTQSGSEAAKHAQEQLNTPDLTARSDDANMVTTTDDWLAPSLYAYFDEPAPTPDGEEPRTLGQVLADQFPNGLHTVRVGDKLCEVLHERLTDHWSVARTGTDDRVLGEALCNDLVPLNEAVNNFFNMAIQLVLQSIPKSIVDASLLKPETIKRPVLGEVILTKTPLGGDLSKMMAKLPTATFSDQLMPLVQMIREYTREIDGIMPAIFGGGPTTQTWREAEQRKNQALAQLGTAYDELVAFWQSAYHNGLRLLAEHGMDQVAVPSADSVFGLESDLLDMQMLETTGWHVEVQEAIPQTFAEEREQFLFMAQNLPPQAQEAIGLFHPASIPRVHQLLSLRGFYCPGAEERDKVIETIRRLLAEEPVESMVMDPMTGQPMIDPMTGAPVPEMLPSIMPDPVLDDHGLMYELLKAWCNSANGRAVRDANPQAFENVRLYAEAQKQAASAMAAPPAGPMPGGPPPPALPPSGAELERAA